MTTEIKTDVELAAEAKELAAAEAAEAAAALAAKSKPPRGNVAARLAVSPVDLSPVQDEIRKLQVALSESENARAADRTRLTDLETFAQKATSVLKGRGLFEELDEIAGSVLGVFVGKKKEDSNGK
jgi:hypothetical protein